MGPDIYPCHLGGNLAFSTVNLVLAIFYCIEYVRVISISGHSVWSGSLDVCIYALSDRAPHA